MRERSQGLTEIYNQLKDPEVTEPRIDDLRRQHIELDRVVLAAYGWQDIVPAPFRDPLTEEEWRLKEVFEDEVIDRLFALNLQRANDERILGVTVVGGTPSRSVRKGKPVSKANPRQLSLKGDR
jgi:hypothetical protein